MATASELSGETSVLRTVVEFVQPGIILSVFGMTREALAALIEEGDAAVLKPLIEKAWEALLLDGHLVSIPQTLLGVASREVIARDLAAILARSPYYTGTSLTTPLGHRVTANSMVTRASYYQLERSAIERAGRLADEVLNELLGSAGAFAGRVARALAATPESLRQRVLNDIAARRGDYATFTAEFDAALLAWQRNFADQIVENAKVGKRVGFQRAVDTLYHMEDERNPWSKLAHPLSALEIGTVLYNFREQVLPIAASKVLVEARGLSRRVRDQISDIITKRVFLQGENPRVAAAEILRRFRAELGERWGGARVSAMRIARTETAFILNEATRVAYEEMGVGFVDVVYTDAVPPCFICPDIAEGGPYPINAVPHGGIPFHPNCRCSYCAAFPHGFDGLKAPPEVIGVKHWAEELARLGFVAVATKRIFGKADPTEAQRAAVQEVIDNAESATSAEAPLGIEREGQRTLVTGYQRIEPDRFPKPLADRFREVYVRDPVRAIYDLRKNAHEIGGIIRGNRILYYKGEEESVALPPIIATAGGLTPGDILFHTHPLSLPGGSATSTPSAADLRLHLWASRILGDGATHYIAGSDGLREIRVEVQHPELWKKNIEQRWFTICMALMEEVIRGLTWWETFGIRRALRAIEDLDLGGRLLVSEPTTPGSTFIPLKPYNAPTRVSPVILSEVNRLSANQLRDIWDRVATEQNVGVFRDRDYYVGLLRELDPSRNWDEAAPTKTKAQEILKQQGVSMTGTRFSKDEIVAHLTGQKVMGRVYLDTTKIDYPRLLKIPAERLTSAIDFTFLVRVIQEYGIGREDVDRIFDYLVHVHGIPPERSYAMKVAALENWDQRGDYYGVEESEVNALLAKVDTTRPPNPPSEIVPSMSAADVARLRKEQEPGTWTDEQKRDIITGAPVHGVVLLPDMASVWWGRWFPGYPEEPPQITPVLASESRARPPTGRDDWTPRVRYSNRHEHFDQEWGVILKEGSRTRPWTADELLQLDYALHLFPEAARAVRTVSRFTKPVTAYISVIERLIVGDPGLMPIMLALCEAITLKVMRVGFYDGQNKFKSPVTLTPFLRDWLAVDPWRLKGSAGILHPATIEGTRALLAGEAIWTPPNDSAMEDPAASLAWHMIVYVMDEKMGLAKRAFIRDRVFGGDEFRVESVDFGGKSDFVPVRYRRTTAVSLA